jgi:hypothetical protein
MLPSDKKLKTSSGGVRKVRKSSDFDIDNYVLPFTMGTNFSIREVKYKEIDTPNFRPSSSEMPLDEGSSDVSVASAIFFFF